jgi:phage shock protein A
VARMKNLLRITQARIDAFLDGVEDPETVLPQLVQELGARVKDAMRAEAKALSACRAARSRLDQALGRLQRLASGAKLAVESRDETLAREALEAQLNQEASVNTLREAVDQAERALDGARTARAQLEGETQSLVDRTPQLLARARQVNVQSRLHGCGHGRSRSLLDEVARIELNLDEDEVMHNLSRVGRQGGSAGGGGSIDERLRDLERNVEVQARMDALRAKVGSSKKPDATLGARTS